MQQQAVKAALNKMQSHTRTWPKTLTLTAAMQQQAVKAALDINKMQSHVGKLHMKITAHNIDAADHYSALVATYKPPTTLLVTYDVPGFAILIFLKPLDLSMQVPGNTELTALFLPLSVFGGKMQ
ncbi:hypothetical protein FOA52_015247 [Chlamydomonas sp. UWO 241]|nr:hypothetical protein FOA52_015247 [Chlamydomonas sp. UWO 241]